MWQKFKRILDEKLVSHFRDSHAPVNEIAIASVVGMFWALTPLVGAQMMLASFTWAILKSVKVNSNLTIAVALVWITNPLTMPFFYYAFYMMGYYAYMLFGFHIQPISYHLFEVTIQQAQNMDLLNGTFHWLRFMINDLGLPMLIGSVVIGFPAAIVSYPLSIALVNYFRRKKAAHEGITLEDWEEIHIYHRKPPVEKQEPAGSEPTPENYNKSEKLTGLVEVRRAS